MTAKELTKEEIQQLLGELVTGAKVAKYLDWQPPQIHAYRKSKTLGFPKPVGEIDGRPVWLWADIKKFKKDFTQRQLDRVKKYMDE